MDEELKRIEEEIRKAKERRQALEDRKNRRMKQIRAKQERDRAFWLKKMSAVLDRTLSEMKGKGWDSGNGSRRYAEESSKRSSKGRLRNRS